MKIGLARRGYSATGGAESYLRRLVAGLAGAGHECVLFGSAAWPGEARPPAGFVAVAGRSPRAFADRLAALRPKEHCDVLFSLERVWGCDCYRAGDGVHRAWLERRAAFEPAWRRALRRWNPKHRELLALEAALLGPRGAVRIIANSRLVAQEIVGGFGRRPEDVAVVYNGLPAAFLQVPQAAQRMQARSRFELADDDYAVLFAGSGWERKGLAFALEAVARLPDVARARLLVAGNGHPGAYPAKVTSGVRFLGPVADMAACYAAADVFVLPTLYDPFSNACLEALAAGLPVLTTTANGFAEVIEPGVDGEVIDLAAAPVEALATGLAAWASRERRVAARPRCAAKATPFTIEANVAATLALITQ